MPDTEGGNPGTYMWDEGVRECTRDGQFVIQYKNAAGDVIDELGAEDNNTKVNSDECCVAWNFEGNTDETLQFACPELTIFSLDNTYVDGVCR